MQDNMKRNNMCIIGIPEGEEEEQGIENYRKRPISLMNIDVKFSTKYCQTASSNILKRSYTMTKWDSSQRCKVVQYSQINKHNTSHKQKERQKSHDYIDNEKEFDRYSTHF